MKKLLKRLSTFFVLLFLLAAVVDFAFSSLAKHTISTDSHIWNDIYNRQVTDPCLIYGSSRAGVHIDPLLVDSLTGTSAYNFGMAGQTFRMQQFRHDENSKYNGYPRYIIYSMDAFTLVDVDRIPYVDQFLPYMLWSPTYYKAIGKFMPKYFFFVPLARYQEKNYIVNRVIKYLATGEEYKRLDKGYNAVDLAWRDTIQTPQVNNKMERIPMEPQSLSNFEDFIKTCKDNNTKLALVYTPEYESIKMYMSNRDSVIMYYDSIATAHDIPFLDYSKDSISMDTTYFYEVMHLNKKGSQLITQKIIKDLQSVDFFETKENH